MDLWLLLYGVCVVALSGLVFFFFKQKTAYEMRISDWSSDVCSSDLAAEFHLFHRQLGVGAAVEPAAGQRRDAVAQRGFDLRRRHAPGEPAPARQIGSASCRESVCQYV